MSEKDTKAKENKKLWVHRPPKPIETTEDDILTGKLACGCECSCCFTAYKTMVEQKALIIELKNALKSEKQAVNEAIKVVEEVEQGKMVDVLALKTEIKDLKDQIASMEHNNEVDSKFRLTEKYKQEEVLLESATYKEENSTLRDAVMQLQNDLESVLAENDKEKQQNMMHEHKNELLVAKMRQYENKIYELEMLNNDLRVKLSKEFEAAFAASLSSGGGGHIGGGGGGGGRVGQNQSYLTNNAQKQLPDPNITTNFSNMYPLHPTSIVKPRGDGGRGRSSSSGFGGGSGGSFGSGLSGFRSSDSGRGGTGSDGTFDGGSRGSHQRDSLSKLMQSSQW